MVSVGSAGSAGSVVVEAAPNSSGNNLDNLGQVALRLAKSIATAVETFASVGETIGDQNAEIREDMFLACREARTSGATLEKIGESLCTSILPASFETTVKMMRSLLAAVTRILLLTDNVVVKQLLVTTKEASPSQIDTMSHFAEFVKAFCDFGIDMVQLVHLIIGERKLMVFSRLVN